MDSLRNSIAERAADFAGSGSKIRSSIVESASDFSTKLSGKMPLPEALARALGGVGSDSSSGAWNDGAVQAPVMLVAPTSRNTAEDKIRLEAMRKKLKDTVSEREVLDKRIQELKMELRFCETSREGLINLEVWLARETADIEEALRPDTSGELTDLNDFLSAPSKEPTPDVVAPPQMRVARAVSANRTQPVRSPRAASPQMSRGSQVPSVITQGHLITQGHREPSLGPTAGSALRCPSMGRLDEWEESIGKDTATCSFCGLKFPLDAEAIDRHSKECTGRKNPTRRVPSREPGVVETKDSRGSRRRSHSWTSTRDGYDNNPTWWRHSIPEFADRRPR